MIRVLAIIPACCAGFLVWQFRGLYYEIKTFSEVMNDRWTWISIIVFFVSLVVILSLIPRQIT